MSNLVDRPTSSRGERRREQLVNAGVALLAEGGWAEVTTRSVAERAGTNPGLIHYHFGGLAPLHSAIAHKAGALVFDPLTSELVSAADLEQAMAGVRRLVAQPPDGSVARLTMELIAGSARDPQIGAVLREGLELARTEVSRWLAEHVPGAPAGSAALFIAMIDGLLLHHLLDPALDVTGAADALADLTREVARVGRQA